jgi:hypothetical protein
MAEVAMEWHDWKKTLHKLVDAGEFIGLSEDSMNKVAFIIGDFLAHNTNPGNREQRLLKDLWDVADNHEQEILATLILKLVAPSHNTH